MGWQVAQFGVQPLAVVEADDEVRNVVHGFGMVGVILLPNAIHLQIQEEALHDRVDAPMSSSRGRVFQVGQDKWVKLTNDVAL